MKKLLKWLLKLVLVLVVLLGVFLAHTWYFKPVTIGLYYNRVFLQFALESPEMLTSLRLLEPLGLDFHNNDLADASLAKGDETLAKLKKDYKVFKSYDRDNYSGQELLSYDIWDQFMGEQVADEQWRYHNFPVNQMFGIQSGLPNFMANQHFVENEGNARNYIERLSKFPIKIDQVLEGLQLREKMEIHPPKFTVEKVLKQMRDFVGTEPSEHMLYTSFKEKLDKISAEDMSQTMREALLTDVATQIKTSVYPAYDKLIAHFDALQIKATSNEGVWRLPDGDAYYLSRVASNTTTNMTPDEIHQIGLQEVKRIAAEMDLILVGAGYTEGTIGQRVTEVGNAPEQLYEDSDAGREQILADYQKMIDEISAGLDPYFSVKPEAPVEVKRIPVFSEKTAPGAYYQSPSLDGKRPGMFFANLRNVKEIPRFGMRTLAYHEAVPGHHFQRAIAQELKGLPMFRKMLPFTAYTEGWALYSEQVAWEAGFQSNPLDNLGRLQAEMFRAVRLVVDTGMHAKRWTREAAIQYMLDYTGMGDDEVVAEIERYLVNPAQALAYKVGMMKILALREKAREQLGDKFDIREFHNEVLKNGTLPLSILERVIDIYIAEKKSLSGAGA